MRRWKLWLIRLCENPRGLLLSVDELAALVSGFNHYKGGQGADVAHWLNIFGGDR